MTQNLNAPMAVPDDDAAWVEDEGSSIPGGTDEKFIARVNAGEGGALADKPQAPSMDRPDNLTVRLPVPMNHPIHGELRNAEVRELTGEDEEYLAKGRAEWDSIARLVERGTVSLDGQEVDRSLVMAMPIGNRDALMLGIRRATYGDDLDLDLTCRGPNCGAKQEITVDLGSEIELIEGEETVEIPLRRGGIAVARWMNAGDDAAVRDLIDKNRGMTAAEVNTVLLGRLLVSVNGQQMVGEASARALSMVARKDIIDFLDKNQPGPGFDTVEHECTECGRKSPLMLSYGELFR